MSDYACCPLRSLTRATAKAAAAKLRSLKVLRKSVDWQNRAEICELCPMKIIHRGVSYCGKPYLQQVARDEAVDGCGCPTLAKAKDPKEHCPVDTRYQPAQTISGKCSCKWCAAA